MNASPEPPLADPPRSDRRWLVPPVPRILPLVVLSAGFLVLGWGVRHWLVGEQPAQSQNASEPVPVEPEQVQVVALGRVEPQGEVIQVGGVAGARIDRLLVKAGDWVEENQVLAYLDSYDERLAARDLAESQLREAEAQLAAETQFQEAQIAETQTRIRQIDQPQAQAIAAQEARLRELQASLSLGLQDLERDQQLLQEGAIAQRDLDRQQTQVEELQSQVKTAEATLGQLKTARSSDLHNAQAQLKTAQANLPLSQIRTAVASARQNLKLAETRLDDAIIYAPQSGRVLRLITRQGEATASSPSGGEEGILELGNTRQMMVVAEVYESDVVRVKVGQTATIRSRNGAFNEPLTGKVTEIGWQIFKNNVLDDDPAANADARVVEVKIQLDQSDRVENLTNLQVDVTIDTQGSGQ
ncbi:MAG: HlyD family efflux transporter periplasmic adaptor subunit [Prochlorotrichaceae cyanobacterium]